MGCVKKFELEAMVARLLTNDVGIGSCWRMYSMWCHSGYRIHLADLMRSSTVSDSSGYMRTVQDSSAGQQYMHSSGHVPGHYANQYSKEAEQSIKTAVGVGVICFHHSRLLCCRVQSLYEIFMCA